MSRVIVFIISILFNISHSFSNDEKPIRITIYPSMVERGVVGSSTKIINYRTISNSSYKTLGDLLSKNSGVFFEKLYYGMDAKSTVRMRGFGEQASRNIMILVDGVRLSDMTIAGANLSRIPIDNIYEIQILKGGSSTVVHGDGAVGGSINIITKNPKYLKDQVNIKSSFKSFDTKENSISINKNMNKFILQTFASTTDSKGYRENNKFENDTFQFDLSYLRDPLTRYSASINYSDEYTGLPGSITLTDFYTRPRFVRSGSIDSFAEEKIQSWKLNNEKKVTRGKVLTTIRYEEKDQKTSSMYSGVNIRAKTDLSTYTLSSKLNKKFTDNNLYMDANVGIDHYNSTYRAIGNNWAGTPYHNIATQKIFEPFGLIKFSNINTPNIEYEAGFRQHYYDLDADNYTNKSSLLSRVRQNHAWSLGFNYTLDNNKNFFGHIARSFRSPRLDEIISLVNPSPTSTDIKHQYSHDIEIGHNIKLDKTNFSIALFRSLIKNQIVYNSAAFANQNFDPSIHQGVELEFDRLINPNFKFISNLNYIDSYFTEGVEKGNETPYVPRLSGNSSIHYNFDKQTNFSFDYKYIGKKRSGNDPNYILSKSKSYQLVDFSINYKTKNFTVKGSINNLLDKKYYTNLIKSWDNKAYVYPQPGRTLFLGLEAKF